ncbi:tyrosine-type recombinase/integrase [Paenibacillus cremeus]|uniref:Integrase n=1 Tax=Paenibacillus cremeus TaxID=2163881 RepID=A0A559KCP4_9BACL|nr:site-specific integrase [Paenibacillus cremeus]TVY09897.1 integrase [Paenibacillus cremeus]
MSNILYGDQIYNEEFKNEFMSQYGKGTQKTLGRIFKISFNKESDLGKDLYDFNIEQIRQLLYLFRPTTEYSSKQNISWISKYISFALDSGAKKGLNPLDFTPNDWAIQFVNNQIKKYWTGEELDKIIDSCVNAQDGVVISLLRNGVSGKESSELLNLKASDVDRDNETLTLTDDEGNRRTIKVSPQCIKLVVRASLELDYEKMNGEPNVNRKADIANLIDTEFVIKTANTNTKSYSQSEKNIIHRRLTKIAADLQEPMFVPKHIAYSGMLEMANSLLGSKDQLSSEDYSLIMKQFGIDGEQSMYRIKSEFLNVETIRNLYPR